MDYVKAYKKALAHAREIHRNEVEKRRDMEWLFPELKESGDEKVRNELIDAIRGLWENDALPMPLSVERKDKWIAWLEKQAERKTPQWMIDFLDNYRRMIGCSLDYDEARDVDGKILCIKEWLEKQGVKAQGKTALEAIKEEKVDNANKLELKFHEGEWIVDNQGLVHQIERVVENVTTHTFGYDIVGGGYFNDKSEGVHLWTIQDAKDGDVLYSSCCGELWIFEDEKKCHVGYNPSYNSGCIVINKPIRIPTDVQPATKEQRDLLFQKMKEASYVYNAIKKELKKIDNEEFNGEDYGIDGLWHAQRILEKTLGKVEGYQSDDGILEHKCAITAVNKLYKQKPAWSEEDEDRMKKVIHSLSLDGRISNVELLSIYDWLKSLKQRIGG